MSKRQIARRILHILIVLIGVSFLTFCLTFIAPGDPVTNMYAASGTMPSEEVLEAVREEMGLNRPFLAQYLSWLKGCLSGDLGTSYSLHRPVAQLLASRLWPTLKLALLSLVLMLAISVPFGMLAAVRQNGVADHIVRVLSFLGASLPNFWVGLLLIFIIGLKLSLLPVVSTGTGIREMILPAVTLAIAMSAKYTRQVRTAVLEELHQDYVSGARTRGLSETAILWKHVFPNSLLPLITLLGLSLGSLLGGTAVVEVIFSYPGLGSLAVSAVQAMDYPLIEGYVLWVAVIYMPLNLIVDISYGLVDPHTRRAG